LDYHFQLNDKLFQPVLIRRIYFWPQEIIQKGVVRQVFLFFFQLIFSINITDAYNYVWLVSVLLMIKEQNIDQSLTEWLWTVENYQIYSKNQENFFDS
jgi:hypothetical protein